MDDMRVDSRLVNLLRVGGIATVAGALVVGMSSTGTTASVQASGAPASATPAPDFVPTIGDKVLPKAAEAADRIERKREKRARQRAQRSSGTMFTPTKNYSHSAVFGQAGGWSSGYHTGLDFAAPSGTPVFAALAGKVIASGDGGAYGNHLQIRHDNGVVTLYAHLSSAKVKTGDRVTRGQVVGAVGSTGNSTGPHLHFEVIKNGTQRNPASFL